MKYLVAVDIQPAFATTPIGQTIYNNCLNYIEVHRADFDGIIAVVYENDGSNPNMERLIHYDKCKAPQEAVFTADKVVKHAGYFNFNLLHFEPEDEIVIIGFDTDACVLSTAFNVFDMGCNFKVYKDLCWSSGGKIMHLIGLTIMERNFGIAITTSE